MKKYILALDEGTTSARSILFDRQMNTVASAQQEFPQIYPESGWVEQDPMQIFATQYATMIECVAKSGVSPEEIAGIGITNQRETVIVWDKNTGKPVYNAIVWQCRRTARLCEQLERDGHGEYIRKATGLKPDAYFSGTKLKWILDNVEGARQKAENGELLFGTVDAWLLWKLTDGRVHATDRTNASRTMLYNIHTLQWDERLCEILDIPQTMLPEVRPSGEIYGYANIMGQQVPVSGIAGDQQAALFGQGCFSAGDVKITYGTGCFLLMNTGSAPVMSEHGLLTTIAATLKDDGTQYALEGSVFTGGSVIQWLRDDLGIIRDAKDTEYFAAKLKDNGGVYIVPAFSGLGAPYWNMRARGVITGLTRAAGRDHIVRAALESIAFQSGDVIEAMKADNGGKIGELKVDGGASANNFLLQFQSNISNLRIIRPRQREATAAGAAMLAGLSVGFLNKESILCAMGESAVFEPFMNNNERKQLLSGWKNAVKICTGATE